MDDFPHWGFDNRVSGPFKSLPLTATPAGLLFPGMNHIRAQVPPHPPGPEASLPRLLEANVLTLCSWIPLGPVHPHRIPTTAGQH